MTPPDQVSVEPPEDASTVATNARRMAGALRTFAAREHIHMALLELDRARKDLNRIIGVNAEYTLLNDARRQLTAAFQQLEAGDHGSPPNPQWGELDGDPLKADLVNAHARGCGCPNWTLR